MEDVKKKGGMNLRLKPEVFKYFVDNKPQDMSIAAFMAEALEYFTQHNLKLKENNNGDVPEISRRSVRS